MAESRVLDDVQELLIPAALAAGGLYLLWWATRTTTTLVSAVPAGINQAVQQAIDYDIPWVGEGDLIDRITYSPQELKQDIGSAVSGVGRAGARIRSWLPW